MDELEQIRAQLFSLHLQVGALLNQIGKLIERVNEPEPEIPPSKPSYLGE